MGFKHFYKFDPSSGKYSYLAYNNATDFEPREYLYLLDNKQLSYNDFITRKLAQPDCYVFDNCFSGGENDYIFNPQEERTVATIFHKEATQEGINILSTLDPFIEGED